MVLAPRESGKLGETSSNNLLEPRAPRPPMSAKRKNEWATTAARLRRVCGRGARGPSRRLAVLVGRDFSLNLDLSGRARIVSNFYRHAPHERLNPAGAGVIFAAIEESQLQA